MQLLSHVWTYPGRSDGFARWRLESPWLDSTFNTKLKTFASLMFRSFQLYSLSLTDLKLQGLEASKRHMNLVAINISSKDSWYISSLINSPLLITWLDSVWKDTQLQLAAAQERATLEACGVVGQHWTAKDAKPSRNHPTAASCGLGHLNVMTIMTVFVCKDCANQTKCLRSQLTCAELCNCSYKNIAGHSSYQFFIVFPNNIWLPSTNDFLGVVCIFVSDAKLVKRHYSVFLQIWLSKRFKTFNSKNDQRLPEWKLVDHHLLKIRIRFG